MFVFVCVCFSACACFPFSSSLARYLLFPPIFLSRLSLLSVPVPQKENFSPSSVSILSFRFVSSSSSKLSFLLSVLQRRQNDCPRRCPRSHSSHNPKKQAHWSQPFGSPKGPQLDRPYRLGAQHLPPQQLWHLVNLFRSLS